MASAANNNFAATPPDKPLKDEEFGFQLHHAVKIFKGSKPSEFSQRMSAVGANNKYGLIAIAYETGVKLYKVNDLLSQSSEAEAKHILDVQTGVQPQHVSFNCDGTLLAVYVANSGGQAACIYIYSFLESKPPVVITAPSADVHLMDLAWNPAVANFLSAIFSDLKVRYYRMDGASAASTEVQLAEQATCMSWSPKGKQLAVGTLSGSIIRVDQAGKTTFVIPASPKHPQLAVCGLFWQSTYTYLAAYGQRTDLNNSNEPKELNFMTVRHGKDKPLVHCSYSDIWICSAGARVNMMLSASIAPWEMVLTLVSNAVDAAMMLYDKPADQWCVAVLDDTSRVSVPMHADDGYTEHSALGLAVCFNSTTPVPLSDTYTHPPSPVVCVLSTDGSLILYHAINRLAGTDHSLVTPPQPVTLPANVVPPPQSSQQNAFKPVGSAFGQPASFGAKSSLGGATPSLGAAATFGAKPAAPSVFGAKPAASAGLDAKPSLESSTAFGGLSGSSNLSGSSSFGGFGDKSGGSAAFGGFGALAAAVQPEVEQQPPAYQPPPQQQPPPPSTPEQRQSQPQQPTQPTQPTALQLEERAQQLAAAERERTAEAARIAQQEQEEVLRLEEEALREEAERARKREEKEKAELEMQRQTDALFNSAIREETLRFNQDLQNLRRRIAQPVPQIMSRAELGDMMNIICDTHQFSCDIKENVQAVNEEIHSLHIRLLDSLAYMDQMKTLYHKSQDPQYRDLINARPLDPKLCRLKQMIEQRFQYMKQELLATDAHLDELWMSVHQDKSKGRAAVNASRTDVIYRTLATIERVIAVKRREVDGLVQKLGLLSIKRSALRSTDLSSSQLNGDGDVTISAAAKPAAKKLSSQKASQLREFLTSRGRVPVVKSAPANLKSTAVQAEHSARKLKLMTAKLSPVKPSQPTLMSTPMSSSTSTAVTKVTSLPHRHTMEVPKQVTQSQPAGLTQPIASRLEIKQPSSESRGITKPLASKIVQPTQDLPAMPGVKSAFNVPVESFGQSGKASFNPVPPQSSATGSPFSFNKPTVSKAAAMPLATKVGGAKPPTSSLPLFAPSFTPSSLTPGTKATDAGVGQTTPSAGKPAVARSLSDMLSLAMTENIADDPVSNLALTPPAGDGQFAFNKSKGSTTPASLFTSASTPALSAASDVTKSVKPKTVFGQASQPASGSIFGGQSGKSGSSAFGGLTGNASGGIFSMKPAPSNGTATSTAGVFTQSKRQGLVFGGTKPSGNAPMSTTSPKGILGGPLPSSSNNSKSAAAGPTPSDKTSPSKSPHGPTPLGNGSTPVSNAGKPTGTSSVPQQASSSTSGSPFGFTSAPPASSAESSALSKQPMSLVGSLSFNTPSSTTTPPSSSSTSLSSLLASNTSTSAAPSAARSLFGTQSAATTATTTATTTAGSLYGQKPTTTATTPFGTQPTTTTTPNAVFGAQPASTTTPGAVFGTQPASTTTPGAVLGTQPTTTTGAAFGTQPTTTTTASAGFGTQPTNTTTADAVFGTQPTNTTTAGAGFGTQPTTTTTADAAFGTQPATTTTTASTLFGTQPTSATDTTGSLFGKPPTTTATSSLFGTQPATTTTATSTPFGSQPTSTSTPSTTSQAPNLFAAAATSSSAAAPSAVFGASATSTTSATNLFGTTNKQSLFGNNIGASGFGVVVTTSATPFGGTTSAFGGTTATTSSGGGTSAFGGFASAVTTPSAFGGGSGFGNTAAITGASVFGGAATNSKPSVFGGTSTSTSSFGGNAFGLGGTPDPAKANQNPFGTTSVTSADSSVAKDLFGGAKSSPFGAPTAAAPAAAASNPFGGAGSTAPASTSGFGTSSGFGAPPAFGSNPAFGAAATFGSPAATGQSAFGGKPTFGSPSVFGGGAAAGGFGQSAFGNKTEQDMPSFGSLAGSTNAPTFGSLAGTAQPSPFGQQQQANTFGSPGFGSPGAFGQQASSPFSNTASPPSNSSFSSYR